jgi:hypothetical protein
MGLGVVTLLTLTVHATDGELVIFDFEAGTEEWVIPDWAKKSEDYVGKELTPSATFVSHGTGSVQVMAEFPGIRWTGAYVERPMYVTDWTPYGSISVDVYLPEYAPNGLGGRFILTVGEKWEWTEVNRSIPLTPGQWTTLTANLKPGSQDWKFFPSDAFRKDVRKIGLRIESDKQPAYTGPLFIDNVRLGP